MTLAKCKECGGAVARKAEICPHCGNQIRKKGHGCGCMATAILITIGGLAYVYSSTDHLTSAQLDQMKPPEVPMSQVAGRYVAVDNNMLQVVIEEAYGQGGWNGTIRFIPAVGDWTIQPRCRLYGNEIAVEIIHNGETSIIKMFSVDSPSTVSGLLDPWKYTFTRID